MAGRGRYEVLQNEEGSTEIPSTPEEPEAQFLTVTLIANEEVEEKAGGEPLQPPDYQTATTLPSYEEAERTKKEEAERQPDNQTHLIHAIDEDLGTDGMFAGMFLITLLFSWLGLLISLCLTKSVAGRFGALAGFGLSLVQWASIAKHKSLITGEDVADSWLWWLIIAMGFLIFIRGCMQYVRIKHVWHQVPAVRRNSAFFFF